MYWFSLSYLSFGQYLCVDVYHEGMDPNKFEYVVVSDNDLQTDNVAITGYGLEMLKITVYV